MAVCLGVAPDVYFIDYNTKRDYQTSNEIKNGAEKWGLNLECATGKCKRYGARSSEALTGRMRMERCRRVYVHEAEKESKGGLGARNWAGGLRYCGAWSWRLRFFMIFSLIIWWRRVAAIGHTSLDRKGQNSRKNSVARDARMGRNLASQRSDSISCDWEEFESADGELGHKERPLILAGKTRITWAKFQKERSRGWKGIWNGPSHIQLYSISCRVNGPGPTLHEQLGVIFAWCASSLLLLLYPARMTLILAPGHGEAQHDVWQDVWQDMT